MVDRFAHMEAQRQALLEEQRRLRRVEGIRTERHQSLAREINELRRANELLRTEIQAWENASSGVRERQVRESPREATPPQENRPAQPEESATSPTKGPTDRNQSDTEASPKKINKPRDIITPHHNTESEPTSRKSGEPSKTQSKPRDRTKNEKHAHSKKHEQTPTISPSLLKTTATKKSRHRTALEQAKLIADSDSEESIVLEIDLKLIMIPKVKLSRLEVVDTSTILKDKTRPKEVKEVTHQLDTRSRKQITKDDRVMRFVGEETRKGFQHNKRTAIRLRKQATWREKRRRQIREWEEASRREEMENTEKTQCKETSCVQTAPPQHRPKTSKTFAKPRQQHRRPANSEDGDAPSAAGIHPTVLDVSSDGGMQQPPVAKVPRQSGKKARRSSEGGEASRRTKVQIIRDQRVKVKVRVEKKAEDRHREKRAASGDGAVGNSNQSNSTQPCNRHQLQPKHRARAVATHRNRRYGS